MKPAALKRTKFANNRVALSRNKADQYGNQTAWAKTDTARINKKFAKYFKKLSVEMQQWTREYCEAPQRKGA